MTGDQSRLLKVGDRVCWKASAADQGAVVQTNWSGSPLIGMTEIQTLSDTMT